MRRNIIIMKRGEKQQVANALCGILAGYRSWHDEHIWRAAFPCTESRDNFLTINVLTGNCAVNGEPFQRLPILDYMQPWLAKQVARFHPDPATFNAVDMIVLFDGEVYDSVYACEIVHVGRVYQSVNGKTVKVANGEAPKELADLVHWSGRESHESGWCPYTLTGHPCKVPLPKYWIRQSLSVAKRFWDHIHTQ